MRHKLNQHQTNKCFLQLKDLLTILMLFSFPLASHEAAHGLSNQKDDPRGLQVIDWQRPDINRVITAGYPETLGLYAFSRRVKTEIVEVSQENNTRRQCVKANFLAFDIKDQLAFDINQTIDVKLLIDKSQTPSLFYGYDKHGTANASGEIIIPDSEQSSAGGSLIWVNLRLEQARFSNRGMANTDLAFATLETMTPVEQLPKGQKSTFVLCDIRISRKQQTIDTSETYNYQFEFRDQETNAPTPVRVGIYDHKGSAILPSDSALAINYYEANTRQFNLRSFFPPYLYWPHKNRYYFYSDGRYQTQLKKGEYTLIVSKGPEYELEESTFEVTGDQLANTPLVTRIGRWKNFTIQDWYSGDVHIHLNRKQRDNGTILAMLKAEDVHVSNLLEMSNTGTTHFKQYAWGKKGEYNVQTHSIEPGIEGPRTAHRGHALALNIKSPIINFDNYFNYHQFLNGYQKQQAVTGYAHVGSEEFNASWGLALDVPYGLVDFVEIMQANRLRTEIWYEFLNLGFKLAPAAGSDYPYFDQPGSVRSYAKINTNKDSDKLDTNQWFDALRGGKTFVSNGPFIQLNINGQDIGSTIDLNTTDKLQISGTVNVNPDYDRLKTIELVQCGEVIKKIELNKNKAVFNYEFEHTINTNDSGWIAVRAYGEDFSLAHTGAIYLADKSGEILCKNKAPLEINKMLARLNRLANSAVDESKELEYWETNNIQSLFDKQKAELTERINITKIIYSDLLNSIDSVSD